MAGEWGLLAWDLDECRVVVRGVLLGIGLRNEKWIFHMNDWCDDDVARVMCVWGGG